MRCIKLNRESWQDVKQIGFTKHPPQTFQGRREHCKSNRRVHPFFFPEELHPGEGETDIAQFPLFWRRWSFLTIQLSHITPCEHLWSDCIQCQILQVLSSYALTHYNMNISLQSAFSIFFYDLNQSNLIFKWSDIFGTGLYFQVRQGILQETKAAVALRFWRQNLV